LGFGVWGLGFGVWGLGFGVQGFVFGVWGLVSGVWCLWSGAWGLGLSEQGQPSCGFQVSYCVFRVWDLGFGAHGFVFRVQGVGSRVNLLGPAFFGVRVPAELLLVPDLGFRVAGPLSSEYGTLIRQLRPDSGQILALSRRQKSFKPFKLFHVRSEAVGFRVQGLEFGA